MGEGVEGCGAMCGRDKGDNMEELSFYYCYVTSKQKFVAFI